jgi:DNA-binding response OmpR family regulator
MPILDGFGATKCIRKIESNSLTDHLPHRSTTLLGRIPIFAVSASLTKDQRPYMIEIGMDGWILKPIDFKRMSVLLAGINSIPVRAENVYDEDRSWEYGGWLESPSSPGVAIPGPEDINPTSEAKTSPPSLGANLPT